jgi:hypothetical protein
MLALRQELGDHNGIAASLNNMGNLWRLTSDNLLAIDYLTRAESELSALRSDRSRSVVLNNLVRSMPSRATFAVFFADVRAVSRRLPLLPLRGRDVARPVRSVREHSLDRVPNLRQPSSTPRSHARATP